MVMWLRPKPVTLMERWRIMNSKVVNKIYRIWENRLRKANKNENGTTLTKALPTNDAANAVLKNMLLEFGVPISEVDKLVYDIIPNKFSLFQEAKDEGELSPEEKEKAYKQGLEGKGGNAWGPKGQDKVTHRVKGKTLEKLPEPQTLDKKGSGGETGGTGTETPKTSSDTNVKKDVNTIINIRKYGFWNWIPQPTKLPEALMKYVIVASKKNVVRIPNILKNNFLL